jgi:hypothetical protein
MTPETVTPTRELAFSFLRANERPPKPRVRGVTEIRGPYYMIMIELEGITEEVTTWRTDVVATIARELGLANVRFEAADPEVFGWYVKNYGPEVNLFVDHSQIVQLECLRRGIWGAKSLWGRVVTHPGA